MTDNMPKIFRSPVRTARKSKRCCECRIAINPGDEYVSAEGLWDSSWESFPTCLVCWDIRNEYEDVFRAQLYPEEMPALGQLIDSIHELDKDDLLYIRFDEQRKRAKTEGKQ